MKTTFTTLKALTCTIFILALCSLAQAQATRTWVSGVGNDINPCSRTAPCKTFAGAISKTAIGGEIDVLDGGGFGSVTITKSITIDGGPGLGSILASGTTGVVVSIAANANDPERRVTLRRLSINGTGLNNTIGLRTGIRGISWTAGRSLYVEDCYIQAFTNEGIRVALTEDLGFLSVKDTNVQNCNVGISFTTTTGNFLATLDRARVERISTTGVAVGTHSHMTIRDSFVVFNGGDGISVNGTATDSTVDTEMSVVSHNNTGIRNGAAGCTIRLSNTAIQDNLTGLASAGGVFSSAGNNVITGNGSFGSPAPIVGQQ